MGVVAPPSDRFCQTVVDVFSEAVHYTHWPTLFMGIFAFAIMYGLKKTTIKIPGVLAAVVATTLLSWLIGFEKDMTVSLDALHDDEIRSRILEYNSAVEEIRKMTGERDLLAEELEDAIKNDLTLLVIEKRSEMEKLDYLLGIKKRKTDGCRRRFNRLLLAGVRTPDGEVLFFRKGEIPEDFDSFGKIEGTWRIRVGSDRLDSSAMTLSSGGWVVGDVPRGLPSFSIPRADGRTVWALLPSAAIIALLGFMEAISIAKAMAAKTGQRIDPNRELAGQGLANLAGSLTQGYPCAGSFSRSAVNLQNGAVSGMSGVFTSIAVAVALLFFTPLLHHLPKAVLAAIIMMAVAGLLNVGGFVYAWRAKWYDGAISVITFVATLYFAPHLDKGIMVGVGLSLSVFLYRSMRPKVVDLSLGKDMALHDVVSYGLRECAFIDAVRFDGPLFFANASYLEDQIRQRRREKKQLKHIILAAEGINDMDASGQESLALVVERLRSAGIDISLSGANETVMRVLKRTHLLARIGEDHLYPSMKEAIAKIYDSTHRGEKEKNCRLSVVRKGSTGF